MSDLQRWFWNEIALDLRYARSLGRPLVPKSACSFDLIVAILGFQNARKQDA